MDEHAILSFERRRPIVRREQAKPEMNGTLTWHGDDLAALSRSLCEDVAIRRMHTTGVDEFDRLTCGVMQGNISIIAGRTGGGKSSFGLTAALTLATSMSLPVLYVSLEMPREDMAIRSMSWITRIPQTLLLQATLGRARLSDEQKESTTDADKFIAQRVRMMAGSFTARQVRDEAKRMQSECGLSIIVLDHIGLVDAEDSKRNGSRERDVADASRAFRKIAMDLNVGGLMLCQMNRESKVAEEPQLWHLRDSGSLEQDASVVSFLWPAEKGATDSLRVFVRKNRFGQQSVFTVPWDGATGQVGEIATITIAERRRRMLENGYEP